MIFLLNFPSGMWIRATEGNQSGNFITRLICWSPSDKLFLMDNCACVLLSLLSTCTPLYAWYFPDLISHSGMQRWPPTMGDDNDKRFMDNCACVLLSLLSTCTPLYAWYFPDLISHSGMQRWPPTMGDDNDKRWLPQSPLQL